MSSSQRAMAGVGKVAAGVELVGEAAGSDASWAAAVATIKPSSAASAVLTDSGCHIPNQCRRRG